MPAQLLPNVVQRFFDSSGNPLAGGSLYSYAAGTTTPLATYTDETATTPNTNPIILNAAGGASVWLGASAYKFVLKDSSGNIQWTADNVSIINPASVDKTKIASNIAGLALLQNGTGAIDVQVDNVTIQITGNVLQVKSGGITADTFSSTSKLEVLTQNVRDFSCPGLYQQIPQYEWTSPSLLSTPSTHPSASGVTAKWCPNGEYLAVGFSASPYLYIYQRSGTTFTNQSFFIVIAGTVFDLDWSPCGDFLAVMHSGSPVLSVFQRVGVEFNILSSPSSLPSSSSVNGKVVFSKNSDWMAVCYQVLASPPSFIMYERIGNAFVDITSTTTLSGIGLLAAWSSDSAYFASIDNATGFIDMFRRLDDIFSGITAPALTAPMANNVSDMAFSPDGKYFVVGLQVSPYLQIFSVASGTFTVISNPSSIPTSTVYCVSWSANSEYLAVGFGSSPYIMIYQVSTSGTFTKIADPSTLPGGPLSSAHFCKTKQFLAIQTSVSPYMQIYETASVLPSNALLWTREAPNV